MIPEYNDGPAAKESFERTEAKLFQAKKPAPKEKPTAESKQGETSNGYCFILAAPLPRLVRNGASHASKVGNRKALPARA